MDCHFRDLINLSLIVPRDSGNRANPENDSNNNMFICIALITQIGSTALLHSLHYVPKVNQIKKVFKSFLKTSRDVAVRMLRGS